MPQWLNTSAQCANQQQRIVKILESVRPVSEQVTTTIQKLLAATVAKSGITKVQEKPKMWQTYQNLGLVYPSTF